MGSRGGPGSPLCLQILTQSSVQSMERGAGCEVLLLCHSASPNPAGWDEFSAQPLSPPPSSRTHLLSLPPRLECATCEDAEITSAFSLFPFCAASLYPPLLSLSLSLFLSLPRSFLSHLLLSILISSRYSQSQNIAHTDAKVALYVGARATNTS